MLGAMSAALSVLFFHQLTILTLEYLGMVAPGSSYSFKFVGPLGAPALINSMFWGGLWGVVYVLIKKRLPGPLWLGGIVFGIVGSTFLGNWIVVALIKGTPMFAGFVPMRMIAGLIIGGMFGLGTALIYHTLDKNTARM